MSGDALPSSKSQSCTRRQFDEPLIGKRYREIGRGVGAVNLVERLEDACLMFRGDARTPCLSH